MPSLGADMQKGVLVQWNIKPGDTVKRGDIIAQIEAEKGTYDMESFDDGIVDRLVVQPGTTIPVGGTMAVLRSASEPAGDQSA
jgi:pyruvate dehydrogenase E2 component (dihydrolipoamide acetyltransferase)